jgi:hypothetical protein
MMNFGNSNIVLSFHLIFENVMNGLKSGVKQPKSPTNRVVRRASSTCKMYTLAYGAE